MNSSKSKIFIIIFLLIFPLFVTGCKKKSRVRRWREDIEFLRVNLPERHKNLFFMMNRNYFNSSLDKISKNVDKLSDIEIIFKLQQLIASMGDPHTTVEWYNFLNSSDFLPIKLYWFKDGIYVIKATEKYRKILGKKVLSINGNPVNKIAEMVSTLVTVNNISSIKNYIPTLMRIAPVLNFFKISNGYEYFFKFSSKDGCERICVKPEKFKKWIFVTDTPPLWWRKRKQRFFEKYFPNGIYYVQYNVCVSSKKDKSFINFMGKVIDTIKRKDVKKFIFDMRYNSGGNSEPGRIFVEKLKKIKKINKRGKLFVVIGRKTFSSAVINALQFKKNTEAVFVGEETGGKPNHYGEIKSFTLPNSGIKIFYSTKYFKLWKYDVNTLVPDIKIETTFKDFVNGVDPVLEWIKKCREGDIPPPQTFPY